MVIQNPDHRKDENRLICPYPNSLPEQRENFLNELNKDFLRK